MWFSVTSVSFSCSGRLRARGTLPWTAATSAVLAPEVGSTGSTAPAAASPAAATTARAGQTSAVRWRVQAVRISQARAAPVRATTKLSTGAPPTAAQPASGAAAWLMASRPQGKPPNGKRSRSASRATHQPATATGQPGSRSNSRWATASTARITADPRASAMYANHQTFSTQDSSGKKKATPNTSPARNEARRPRPARATVSRATPIGASGQMPSGGNEAASSSPPASATSRAQRSRSPRWPPASRPRGRAASAASAEITPGA